MLCVEKGQTGGVLCLGQALLGILRLDKYGHILMFFFASKMNVKTLVYCAWLVI